VVAVSTISYGSYLLQKLIKKRGVVLSALFGGAYSSTVTTIVMARRAATEKQHSHLFAGAILMASGVMYLRLITLIACFNRRLAAPLAPSFLVLAGLAIATGWLWSRRPDAAASPVEQQFEQPKNPLELRTAFFFAALFLIMLIATQLAIVHLGRAGIMTLAIIMGITDVDPFIMGTTQAAGSLCPMKIAAAAILVAAASNNLIKGIYARSLADKETGRQSLYFLAGLGVLGLTPLLWL